MRHPQLFNKQKLTFRQRTLLLVHGLMLNVCYSHMGNYVDLVKSLKRAELPDAI
jgi:hypothetical protein